jgi:hypothetical protein
LAHYFRNATETSVKVHFETSDGKPINNGQKQPVHLTKDVPLQSQPGRPWFRRWFSLSDHASVETLRLLLALGIAVLALVAGAREQLLKLDVIPGLIGVFLLGFGADAVKNLFTKR